MPPNGVKANVLFFDNHPAAKNPWTKEIWYYDYRTNVHHTLKRKPMRFDDLAEFIASYNPANRHVRKETWHAEKNPDGRWRKYSYADIVARDKTSLDIFWLKDKSLADLDNLPNPKRRNALLAQTLKHGWLSPELERQVRALALSRPDAADAAKNVTPAKLLTPQRGTPGLHPIVDRGDGLAVDLGFKLYWPLNADQVKRFAKGDIVRIASDDSLRRADDATKADLFTYAATLRRVVDGDTLLVALEVSPGVFIEQKLRLRGLDCPEMKTPEGKAAKRFVEALIAKTTAVTINTSKPDKYDRYLADVFLTTESGEIFLNNTLLENDQAVRKDAADFEENWGFK